MIQDIFKEKGSVKYTSIAGTKFDIKGSPFYTFDRYNKTVSCKLTFEWDRVTDDILNYEVVNRKNGIRLVLGRVSLNKQSKKHSCALTFYQNYLNGNLYDIELKMSIERKVEVTDVTSKYYKAMNLLWGICPIDEKKMTSKVIDSTRMVLKQSLRTLVDDLRIR